MNAHESSTTFSRRRLLSAGGATVLGAATLAACSGTSVVNTSGTVPTTLVAATAPPTTADAATLEAARSMLRTLTSLEHSLAAFYDTFTAAAYLDEDAKSWGTLFGSHHRANATSLEELTVTAGGKAFGRPNTYVDKTLIAPAVKVANASKSASALIALANQLEATGAATGTLAVSSLVEGTTRQGVMAVAATNARQAYVWRLMAKPGDLADALPDARYPLRDALPGAAAVDKSKD